MSLQKLTSRERAVAESLVRHVTLRAVARVQCVSYSTARRAWVSARRKMQWRDVADCVLWFARGGATGQRTTREPKFAASATVALSLSV